jgi:hypothetical protein
MSSPENSFQMQRYEIIKLLEAEGFEDGRVFDDFEPISDLPHVILRKAALVTITHGMIWNGDVELNYDGNKLSWIANQVGENFYVLDPAGIAASDGGSIASQIRHAVWWTCITRDDEDGFYELPEKSEWAAQDSTCIQDPTMLPGVNWASQVTYCGPANAVPPWLAAHPTRRSLRTAPVVIHRSGPHILVWFEHGKAVFKHDLCALFGRFGDLQFVMSEDKKCIGAKMRGGGPVAMISPSPVPNHRTVALAVHELGMRRSLSPREWRQYSGLIELLRDELDHVQRRGEPRELYRAVSRVLWVLGIRPAEMEVPCRFWASVEWRLCPSVAIHPEYCTFVGTTVPVDSLFRHLAGDGRVEDYLTRNPEVKAEHVTAVLSHAAHSLRL